jgi:GNAT superfamily N-acetyltransferase
MANIRPYRKEDAHEVGQLIADTYTKCNLLSIPPEDLSRYLGPFTHAYSVQPAHQQAIAEVIHADMVFVAEEDKQIAGILRGRCDKLQSLFVRETLQRRGIGRQLVETFEKACRDQGSDVIKVQATLYAIPFYTALGYKRTTGVRRMMSFEGTGLPYQPMKKRLIYYK